MRVTLFGALLFAYLSVAAILINGPNSIPESMDWDPVGQRALFGGIASNIIYSVNLQGGISSFFTGSFTGTFGIQVDAPRNQVLFVNGSFPPPPGDVSGSLYAVNLDGTLKWVSPLGNLVQATSTSLNDVAVDAAGNAYVTDALNSAIYMVTPTGTPSLYLQNTTLWPQGLPYYFNLDGIDFFPGGDWFIVSLFHTVGKLFTVKTATKEVNELVVYGIALSGPDGIVFSPDGTRLVVTDSLSDLVHTFRSLDGWRTAYAVSTVNLLPTGCTSTAGQWFGSRYFASCNNGFAGPSSLLEVPFPLDNFIGTLQDTTGQWDNFTCVPSESEGATSSALALYQCYWRDIASGLLGHATIKVDAYGNSNGTGQVLSAYGSYAYGCNATYDIGSEYGVIYISVMAPQTDHFSVKLTNLKGTTGNSVTRTLLKTNTVNLTSYQCNPPGPQNFLGLAGSWDYEGHDLALCVRRNGGNSGFPYQIVTSYRAFDSDAGSDYNGNDLLGYAVYNVLSKDNTWGKYTECFPGNRLFDVGSDGMVILDDDTILMFWQSTVALGPSDVNPFGNLWSGLDYAKRKNGNVSWTCDKFATCAGNLGPKNPYSSDATSRSASLLSFLLVICLPFLYL